MLTLALAVTATVCRPSTSCSCSSSTTTSCTNHSTTPSCLPPPGCLPTGTHSNNHTTTPVAYRQAEVRSEPHQHKASASRGTQSSPQQPMLKERRHFLHGKQHTADRSSKCSGEASATPAQLQSDQRLQPQTCHKQASSYTISNPVTAATGNA